MEAYVSGEGLSEEDDVVNMALVGASDPISFEEAVKSAKWRQAMEAEITAIEKNKTWKLVHCGTQDQIADIMTKPLKLDSFQKLRMQLGVCKVPKLNKQHDSS